MALRFPSPLFTERLCVRHPGPDDAEAINLAIRETWSALNTWMHWAVSIPDLEETRQHQIASAARAERGEDFPLLCFERASGEFVLATALHPVSIEVPSFQIGYWCRARFEGKGYVTEAVRAISEVALHSMGANRIEIRCDVVNHRSRAVAERCGFQLEGVLKNECRTPDGRLRSTALYVRVPDTYFAPEA